MSKNTMYSNFKQTTFLNGKKYKDKEYNFAINPNDEKKVYAYLKVDDDQYIYEDDLENFYNIFTQKNNDSLDLFDLLNKDIQDIDTFDKFDKIKIKSSSRLSKKQREKYIKMMKKNNHQHDDDFIVFNNKFKTKTTRKYPRKISRKRKP